jgi:hypothetical protein
MDDTDYTVPQKIDEMARALMELQEKRKAWAFEEIMIITKNNITDEARIEHLIDELIDIDWFSNVKFYLQVIIRYYSKINLQASLEYIDFYKRNNEPHWQDIELK